MRKFRKLTAAGYLAECLLDQLYVLHDWQPGWRERYAEAKEMLREVFAVRTRVLGAEDPDTLAAAVNLHRAARELTPTLFCAHVLMMWVIRSGVTRDDVREKHEEAEEMLREKLAVQKRVLGGNSRSFRTSSRSRK